MLTNFDGVDFEKPIKRYQQALARHDETRLNQEIGQVARDNADDEWEPTVTIGSELRRQYEGMNDEHRKGFDAALIALTGLCYEAIVEDAITRLGGV